MFTISATVVTTISITRAISSTWKPISMLKRPAVSHSQLRVPGSRDG